MINKKISFLIVVAIVTSGIVVGVILAKQEKPMRRSMGNGSLHPVKVLTVKNSDLKSRFDIGGHLYAFDKVDLYAEVSGILGETQQRFKEGERFKKGQILIKIDDSVYRNQVLAQKSSLLNQLTLLLPDLSIDFPNSAEKWQSFLHEFDFERELAELPEPASDQERYYIASRNIYNLYYTIKGQEATLRKYNLYAPFDGIVTESSINTGTLVRAGQKLGTFTNTKLYELEAFASVFEIEHLKVGDPVELTTDDVEGTFKGVIQRINEVIDPATQTLKVYIVTSDRRLREGMYCIARVTTQNINNAYRLPRNLLIGEHQLYAVNPDSTLRLTDIEPVTGDEEYVIVQGLEDNMVVLGQPMLNIYEGLKLDKMIMTNTESKVE